MRKNTCDPHNETQERHMHHHKPETSDLILAVEGKAVETQKIEINS